MRLWSLHPGYLDRAGLTACWREGLLARKVLEGNTKGYKNHPQLFRFKQTGEPLSVIDAYLHVICDEADRRGYSFDRCKLGMVRDVPKIKVNKGQMEYEAAHLSNKLLRRDKVMYDKFSSSDCSALVPHPLFEIIEGPVEEWEIIK